MALSDSKFNDPQSGMETGVGAFLAASGGINSVSGPGMLDYVNCFSFEKLVFDDEVVAHAKRFVRPVEVRDDLPAAELIAELVRDKHLLTSEHTLEHWPEELYLPGADGGPHQLGPVGEQGSRDWRARANEVIDETLASYEVEPLCRALHAEIRDRCSRRPAARRRLSCPPSTEKPDDARLRAHEPAALRGQARAGQEDDRGGARRGPPGDGGAGGGPDRRDARRGRGLQAQPHLRARGAAGRARHEGRHGGAEAAPHRAARTTRKPRP